MGITPYGNLTYGRAMKFLLKSIDAISENVGKWFSFALYGAMVILLYEVTARYLFNAPTTWVHQTSLSIFGFYYFLAGAYVLRHNAHINMDIIYKRFSLRTRAIIDLITAFVFFAMCITLVWHGSLFALRSISILEVDSTPLRAPLYPVKIMLPVGAFLLLLQGLAKFTRDFITAVTGRQYEH